jgi:anti-sigma B factor antagonist
MPIEIGVSTDPTTDVATVTVSGELDLASASELDRSLSGVQNDGRTVVLDLRRVSFMDSSGLRVILSADARARSADSRLVLIEGPPGVQRVFHVTLLDRRLEFVADPAEIQR